MKTVIFLLVVTILAAPIQSAPTAVCDPNSSSIGCASCVDTSSNSACDKCKAGYKFSFGHPKTCSLCSIGGSVNENVIENAEPCPIVCNEICQTCADAAGTCTTCKAGYFMSAAGVCTWCTGGKGKNADQKTSAATVATLAAACVATCTPASNCGTCAASALGVCLTCGPGRYLDTAVGATKDTCVSCTTGCKTCTTTGLTNCPTCSDNFYYSATNTCTACETGKIRTAPTPAPTMAEQASVCTVGPSTNNPSGNSNNNGGTNSSNLVFMFRSLFGIITTVHTFF